MSGISQIKRAQTIQKSLGTRTAAGYMRNQGWSLNTALRVLAGRNYPKQ